MKFLKESFRILFICVLFITYVSGQNIDSLFQQPKYDSIKYEYTGYIFLDSIVVTASRNGFNIKDFIDMVMTDNSFYRAFKNLHFANYDFTNNINFYNKKDVIIAEYRSKNHQYYANKCRRMKILHEEINHNFFKRNHKYKYYTAKLYDRLFYTDGLVCNEDTSTVLDLDAKEDSKMEEYVIELKKLIFSPGRKANIPFIGKKMEIFSPKMRKYYKFSIKDAKYQDSIPCYLFTATLKPGLSNSKKNKTVLKYMNTYFSKKDFQIVARNYHLKYKTLVYNFDVKMDVKLRKTNKKYFPTDIKYDGSWHILFKKREHCKFSTKIYNIIY